MPGRLMQEQASTPEGSHLPVHTQLPSTLDMGTAVPIAITVMFTRTRIFVTCDKFVIMYMCCVGAVHNT